MYLRTQHMPLQSTNNHGGHWARYPAIVDFMVFLWFLDICKATRKVGLSGHVSMALLIYLSAVKQLKEMKGEISHLITAVMARLHMPPAPDSERPGLRHEMDVSVLSVSIGLRGFLLKRHVFKRHQALGDAKACGTREPSTANTMSRQQVLLKPNGSWTIDYFWSSLERLQVPTLLVLQTVQAMVQTRDIPCTSGEQAITISKNSLIHPSKIVQGIVCINLQRQETIVLDHNNLNNLCYSFGCGVFWHLLTCFDRSWLILIPIDFFSYLFFWFPVLPH